MRPIGQNTIYTCIMARSGAQACDDTNFSEFSLPFSLARNYMGG